MSDTVYVVHSWSEPDAVFTTKELAALWVYEHHQANGGNYIKQIVELKLNAPYPNPEAAPQ
jgi:hypothetical protein